jgi:hypothetical protein
MAGLVPAIHAAPPGRNVQGEARLKGVDGRDKPGHDVRSLGAGAGVT